MVLYQMQEVKFKHAECVDFREIKFLMTLIGKGQKKGTDAQTDLSVFDNLSFTLMCSKPSHSTPKFSRIQCSPFVFLKGSL